MEKAKQRAQRFGIVSGLALEGSLCEAAYLSDSYGNIETVDSIMAHCHWPVPVLLAASGTKAMHWYTSVVHWYTSVVHIALTIPPLNTRRSHTPRSRRRRS